MTNTVSNRDVFLLKPCFKNKYECWLQLRLQFRLQIRLQHQFLASFELNVSLARAAFCIKKALALPIAVGGFECPHNHARARFALLHARRGLNLAGIEFWFGEWCPLPSPALRARILWTFVAIKFCSPPKLR